MTGHSNSSCRLEPRIPGHCNLYLDLVSLDTPTACSLFWAASSYGQVSSYPGGSRSQSHCQAQLRRWLGNGDPRSCRDPYLGPGHITGFVVDHQVISSRMHSCKSRCPSSHRLFVSLNFLFCFGGHTQCCSGVNSWLCPEELLLSMLKGTIWYARNPARQVPDFL